MKKTGVWFAVLMISVLVVATWLLGLRDLPEKLSFGGGDGMLGEALIKGIVENGLSGNLSISRMGAPETSSIVDTPFLDWLYVIQVYVISFFSENPGVITVVFYLVTFLTSASTMFFLLRKMGCGYIPTVVFSFLFSFSTYHAFRGMGHMTLSNYFMVPLAIYLAYVIATDQVDEIVSMPFQDRKKSRIFLVLISFLLGFTNIYYVAFGMIFMTFAWLYRVIRTGKIKSNMKYLGYIGLTVLGTVIALSPQWIHVLVRGTNPEAAVRSFANAESYGLKIIQLLFPPFNSRLWGAAGLTEKYQSEAPLISENNMSALGLIGTVAFIGLCVYLIVSFIRKKGKAVYEFSSLCVLVAVLVGTIGGFGVIFNFFITAEIRCYCRISIYILCFCYAVAACILSKLNHKRMIQGMIVVLLLVIAKYDQIPVPTEKMWVIPGQLAQIYEQFYSEMEDQLPDGAMVYQIPFVSFPEPPSATINNMDAYSQLSAYIYTEKLRFSYGGVKGRNNKAGKLYVDKGMSNNFVRGIKNAGFSGVCIHINGYSKSMQTRILEFYNARFGMPLASIDGTMYFYRIK